MEVHGETEWVQTLAMKKTPPEEWGGYEGKTEETWTHVLTSTSGVRVEVCCLTGRVTEVRVTLRRGLT